jgi:hypothetical protein
MPGGDVVSAFLGLDFRVGVLGDDVDCVDYTW